MNNRLGRISFISVALLGGSLFGAPPAIAANMTLDLVTTDSGDVHDEALLRNGLNCFLVNASGYEKSPPTVALYSLVANGTVSPQVLRAPYASLASRIASGDGRLYFRSVLATVVPDPGNVSAAMEALHSQDRQCLQVLAGTASALLARSRELGDIGLVGLNGERYSSDGAREYLTDLLAKLERAGRQSDEWHGLYRSRLQELLSETAAAEIPRRVVSAATPVSVNQWTSDDWDAPPLFQSVESNQFDRLA